MKRFGIIGIVFCVLQTNLLGVPQFTLPNGMTLIYPQTHLTPNRKLQQINHSGVIVDVEDVEISGGLSLYFPTDGSQPDTQDAGVWSGARYIDHPHNGEITDWFWRRSSCCISK